VKRLLVVWCPELQSEEERGRQARALARVVAALEEFSPAVEVVRPGACATSTRGPSRYFGGDAGLAERVARTLARIEGAEPGTGVDAGIGVADGLFAALLAARVAVGDSPVIVEPGHTPQFLAPWPIGSLERPELADLLARLGIGTLGRFARLPTAAVLARFGLEGVACHRVAMGIEGELPSLRAVSRAAGVQGPAAAAHQPGFFGGAAGADARAVAAVQRVVEILGPESVVVVKLQGGRDPGDRARLVPFGAGGDARPHDDRPWPGQVPSPAPALVFARPLPALLEDAEGRAVGVTGGGMVSGAPSRLSLAGERWRSVSGWAGPWPVDERWWSARRRRARMQVLTAEGVAHLLVREHGGWWLEGTYD
jgi:hypothetical protein